MYRRLTSPSPSGANKNIAGMFEPTNALILYGIDIRAETRPRHLSVVMSAMMICVSSYSPVYPLNRRSQHFFRRFV